MILLHMIYPELRGLSRKESKRVRVAWIKAICEDGWYLRWEPWLSYLLFMVCLGAWCKLGILLLAAVPGLITRICLYAAGLALGYIMAVILGRLAVRPYRHLLVDFVEREMAEKGQS